MKRNPSPAVIASLGIAAMATAGLGAAGCANVKIRKVPTPTQYLQWSDEMQRRADKMEGIRFYLPRPFLNVFESFPVRTDIYFAHGLVSPDGQYVRLLRISETSEFNEYIAASERIEIPANYVLKSPESFRTEGILDKLAPALLPSVIQRLGRIIGGQEELAGRGEQGAPRQPMAAAPLRPPPRTGIQEQTVTNDNMAFAYQPLRGNFDLVYMPDFEEQYAASGVANLGNVSLSVNLGQGWSLQGLNSLVDNSALNERIFDLIDTAIAAAKGAASMALGFPLPGVPEAPTELMFRTEGDASAGTAEVPGTYVTMKIVVVHYAAKGLYPVIKPRELQQRQRGQEEYFGWLDLFHLFPNFRLATEYDPDAIEASARAVDNESRRFTVPRYPYQFVSFNTFRYIAIEVLKTDAQPFGVLYDKTGTEGKVGEARRGEVVDLLGRLREIFGTGTAAPQSNANPPAPAALDQLINAIVRTGSAPVAVPEDRRQPHYVVAEQPRPALKTGQPGVLEVTLVAGSAAAPPELPAGAGEVLLRQINLTIDRLDLGLDHFEGIEIRPSPG